MSRTSSLLDESDSVLGSVLDLLPEAVMHEEPPRVLVDSLNHLLLSPHHLGAGSRERSGGGVRRSKKQRRKANTATTSTTATNDSKNENKNVNLNGIEN